jgi:type VI secretion system secreted protein VgrG
MPPDTQRRFALTVSALAPDTFEVVSFSGHEALSTLYAFDLVLLSRREDRVDPEAVIASPATFTLHGQDGAFAYHGLACSFEQTGQVDDFTFYRLRLVPRPHLLTLGENNRIFLDKPLNAFLEEIFRAEGLAPGMDFEWRLAKSYPKWPHVSQFRETSFAFVSRWLERDGLYYFFEQGPSGARMVITDTKAAHQPLPGKTELRYQTPSGLVPEADLEAVFDFRRCLRPVPASVLLADWNYETPSVDLKAQAPVLDVGRGAMRLFGDHFRTIQEGRDLAAIRAEELLCRRDVAEGSTSFPGLTAGRLFRLANHFQDSLNREYLVTAVRHEGRQFAFLTAGLGLRHEPDGSPETYYRNAFHAIPSNVQFRPERATPWPRQEGLFSGVIDGAGSDKYAEVDEAGRYKVRLAYDRSGREGGKASMWLRLAQPYGGADHGLHFPLHKGCEVVLACQDGDPDRPVILGSLPNPDHKSVVTSANQTRVNLETGGKNQIYFEDKEGSQRALLQSTTTQSFLRLGVPNDPFPDFEPETDEQKNEEGIQGLSLKSPYGFQIVCGSMLSTYLLGYFDTIFALQTFCFLTNSCIQIGAAEGIAGKTFKGSCSESEIGAIAERLHATEAQVHASKTHIVDALIDARTRITTLDGQLQTLRGELTTLRGDVSALAGDVTNLCQDENALCGQVSTLLEQKTSLMQENTDLSAEVNVMAQSKVGLHTSLQKLAGEVTALEQTSTQLDTERTQLFAQNKEIGAAITHGSTMDLTI